MGVADDFAPSFVKKPQLRQEDDGNRLIFECELLSAPKPEIEWYRSDELLTEDGRTNFKIQSSGDNKYTVILDIDDVAETDAGLYKVKAKNAMGEVAASINLNFSRKWICIRRLCVCCGLHSNIYRTFSISLFFSLSNVILLVLVCFVPPIAFWYCSCRWTKRKVSLLFTSKFHIVFL